MIYVDSNIPMYLIGSEHPNKVKAYAITEELVRDKRRLVTSAETFQEILHRYSSIDQVDLVEPAFEVLKELCDEVIPVTESVVFLCKEFILKKRKLSARDALHLSTMKQRGVNLIFSFDSDFDSFSWLDRIC